MADSEEVMLKPELVSKTAFLYASTIGGAILSYIALFFATRFVGDIGYGVVAFGLSFAGVFLFVTDFGLSSSHTKKVSEGKDLQSCLSVYLLTRLALVGVFAGLVLAALFMWEDVLGQRFGDSETHLVILIVLMYYIQSSITTVFSTTFLAQRDVLRAQAIALSDVMARAVATLLVIAMGWGLVGLACTYAIEGFVALAVALFLARGRLPRVRLSAANKALFKEYVKFATPIAVATVFGTIVLFLDKIIIQYSSISSAETGIYYAAQRILAFYLALSPVISSVAYPLFSQRYSKEGGKEWVSQATTSMIRYFIIGTIPIMFFLIVFSGEILSIFLSASFAAGAVAFSLLAIAYSIDVAISPFSSQTLGMGLSRTYGKIQLATMVLIIILDFILIPTSFMSIPLLGWGINGAAASYLVGQVLLMVLYYENARRVLKLKAPKGLVSTTCASALAIAAVYLLSTYVNITRFYDIVALLALYVGVFICLAVLFRAVTVKELRDLLKMLRQKNLLHIPHK